MSVTSVRGVSHSVTRLTVDVGAPFGDFQARYEEAVPAMPVERIAALAARNASRDATPPPSGCSATPPR